MPSATIAPGKNRRGSMSSNLRSRATFRWYLSSSKSPPTRMFVGCKARSGSAKKMTDPAELTQWFGRYSIQRPGVPELIVVDVTDLSPEQAAHAVLDRLNLLTPTLQPATLRH